MLLKLQKWLRIEFERLWSLGILHVATSIAFVQGASLFSQFVLASVFSPEEFATVKIVENTIRLLLIPAMAGIPTATVKYVAQYKESNDDTARLLGQAIILAFTSSFAIGVLTVLFAKWAIHDTQTVTYVSFLVWTVCFTSVVRTIVAYYQGLKQLRLLAIYNLIAVFISLLTTIGGGYLGGIKGWAIGRFVGEVIVLIIVLFSVRGKMKFVIEPWRIRQLATLGGLALISLLFGRIIQMTDVIILARNGIDAAIIGAYGLATSIITMLTLPVAAIMAAGFPFIAEQHTHKAAWDVMRRILWRTILLNLVICTFTYILSPHIITFIWGQAYTKTYIYLNALLPLLFLNSILTVVGTFFFATAKAQYPMIANFAGLILYLLFSSWAIEILGVTGIILILTITTLIRLGLFSIFRYRLIFHTTYQTKI